MSEFVPVNEVLLNGNEKAYLNQCIDSGWISSEGPFVRQFEEQFAARVNRKYGVSVCNGSVALQMAVAALGLGPGDEVIMPSFTIISCAAAIVYSGATPVLVDSDPCTWNMNLTELEAKVTPRTKAIMIVHTFGLPVDMDPLPRDRRSPWAADHRGRCGNAWSGISRASVWQFWRPQHFQFLSK